MEYSKEYPVYPVSHIWVTFPCCGRAEHRGASLQNMLVQLPSSSNLPKFAWWHTLAQPSNFCFLISQGGFLVANDGKVSFSFSPWSSAIYFWIQFAWRWRWPCWVRQRLSSFFFKTSPSWAELGHTRHMRKASFPPFSYMEKLFGFSGCLCRLPGVVGSVGVEMTHKNLCAAPASHPAYKTLHGLKPYISKPVKLTIIISNLEFL